MSTIRNTLASQLIARNEPFLNFKEAQEFIKQCEREPDQEAPDCYYVPILGQVCSNPSPKETSTQSLTYSRIWGEETPQVQAINAFVNGELETVKVECQDGVRPSQCQLILNQNEKHSIQEIFVPVKDATLKNNPDAQDKLVAILNCLFNRECSLKDAKRLLKSAETRISELIPGLAQTEQGTLGSSTLGGVANSRFKAETLVNEKVQGLFAPYVDPTTFNETKYTLETDCTIQKNGETCHFTLLDSDQQKINTLVTGNMSEKIFVRSESDATTIAYHQIQNQLGLYTSGPTSDTVGSETVGYETHTSYLQSLFPSLQSPKITDWFESMLIPLGLGISFAGLLYAKSNYEHKKKSTLRKTVGCITGVGMAALGIALSTIPFGSLDSFKKA